MRAPTLLLLLGGLACAPAIPAAPPLPPSRELRQGPALPACLVLSELSMRPRAAAVAGASLGGWRSMLATVLIAHPKGLVAIDPALGVTLAEDLAKAPLWFRLFVNDGTRAQPLVRRLEELGVEAKDVRYALVTHAHWDHTGALRELPAAEIWMSRAERDWALSLAGGYSHGAFPHQVKEVAARVRPFELDGPAHLGFGASKDLFGDGSVVALPLPGHTPGSTAYLVRAPGRQLLFVGDTAWALEGVERPAHKGALVRALVDSDAEGVARALSLLHRIHTDRPDVAVLPSHDARILSTLPECTPALVAAWRR